MNLVRFRRFVPLVLAGLMAWTTAAPATADSLKAPPIVLAADTINSTLGFVGCIPINGVRYCFAAQRIVDGPDAGAVSVTSRVAHSALSELDHTPFVPHDAVYEQVVAPTALERVSDHELTLRADLDGIGSVDLNMSGVGRQISEGSRCGDEGVRGEVVAPSLGAGYVLWVSGSIGGREYRGGGCLPFFWVGPAVGSWYMGF